MCLFGHSITQHEAKKFTVLNCARHQRKAMGPSRVTQACKSLHHDHYEHHGLHCGCVNFCLAPSLRSSVVFAAMQYQSCLLHRCTACYQSFSHRLPPTTHLFPVAHAAPTLFALCHSGLTVGPSDVLSTTIQLLTLPTPVYPLVPIPGHTLSPPHALTLTLTSPSSLLYRSTCLLRRRRAALMADSIRLTPFPNTPISIVKPTTTIITAHYHNNNNNNNTTQPTHTTQPTNSTRSVPA